MPGIETSELESKVSQFLTSVNWTKDITTKEAARDLDVVLSTMISYIVDNCMSGGGKGPGPIPHRPPPPWPVQGGAVSRREDYLANMTGLLLNIANAP